MCIVSVVLNSVSLRRKEEKELRDAACCPWVRRFLGPPEVSVAEQRKSRLQSVAILPPLLPPSRPPPSFPLFGPVLTLRARGFPFGFVGFRVPRSCVLASSPSFRLTDPPGGSGVFRYPSGGRGKQSEGFDTFSAM